MVIKTVFGTLGLCFPILVSIILSLKYPPAEGRFLIYGLCVVIDIVSLCWIVRLWIPIFRNIGLHQRNP